MHEDVNTETRWREILSTKEGFVFNDFSRGQSGKENNILHAGSCRFLQDATLGVAKVFFTALDDAVEWLDRNRPALWRPCSSCRPARHSESAPSSRGYDVFVSYARADAERARQFVDAIRSERPDWRVFVDTEALQGRDYWRPRLLKEVERCRAFVAVLSKAYMRSYTGERMCFHEYETAAHRELEGEQGILLQVLLEEANFTTSMKRKQWRDLREPLDESPDFGALMQDLAGALGGQAPSVTGAASLSRAAKVFLDKIEECVRADDYETARTHLDRLRSVAPEDHPDVDAWGTVLENGPEAKATAEVAPWWESASEPLRESASGGRTRLTKRGLLSAIDRHAGQHTASLVDGLLDDLESLGLRLAWQQSAVSVRLRDPRKKSNEFTVVVVNNRAECYVWLLEKLQASGYDPAIADDYASEIERLCGMKPSIGHADSHSSVEVLRKCRQEFLGVVRQFANRVVEEATCSSTLEIDGFTFLGDEMFECGGVQNTVAVYRHEEFAKHLTIAKSERDPAAEFVLVPGGEFMMGSEEEETESPEHAVTVARFLLARTPVVQAVYCRLMGAGPVHDEWKWKRLPVEDVSWKDLHKKGGFLDRTALRLPTEAEWEHACRAGTNTDLWYGDEEPLLSHELDPDLRGRQVAALKPNPFGLFDMQGSVAEWCRDAWRESYIGAPVDGSAREDGEGSLRVIRGGPGCMGSSTARSKRGMGVRESGIGFRTARSV